MVMLKQPLLVKFLVVLFLVTDVLADRAFVDAHGRYEVPPSPEVMALEPLMPPHEIAGDTNRTLALDVHDNLSNRVLWRNANHHMHMIPAQMSFQYLALPMSGQLVKKLS